MVKFTETSEEEKDNNDVALTPVDASSAVASDADGKTSKDAAKKEPVKEKRRRRKAKAGTDGEPRKKKRRNSLSKAPRDPRDGVNSPIEEDIGTRSPSPVIDFDGLSKPSKLMTLVIPQFGGMVLTG